MFRGVRLDSLNYVNAAHLLSYYRNTSAYTVKTTSSEAFLLKEYIEERAVEIGNYIIETKATVRQTAKKFGVSKSTVHKDVTSRLVSLNPALARQAREVLDVNKSERHIRGGLATREKYLHQHKELE
nr:sporulation transcriptional regulator SpoIIID [uncultured Blautia sp.]